MAVAKCNENRHVGIMLMPSRTIETEMKCNAKQQSTSNDHMFWPLPSVL